MSVWRGSSHLGFVFCLLLSGITNVPAFADSAAKYASSPFIQDDYLCVTNGSIACYDADSGRLLWHTPNRDDYDDPVIEGRVLIAGTSGGVQALDVKSGRILWTRNRVRAFSPTVLSTIAYVPGIDGTIDAINTIDGTHRWSQRFDGWIYAPAIVDKYLLIGGEQGTLTALHARTGERVWQRELPNELVFRPAAGTNADVIVTTFTGEILSISASDGAIRWQAKEPVAALTPTVGKDWIAYFSLDQHLTVRKASSGDKLWRSAQRYSARQPWTDGQLLFVTNDENQTSVLNPQSGEVLAQINLPGRSPRSPISPARVDQKLISFVSDRQSVRSMRAPMRTHLSAWPVGR